MSLSGNSISAREARFKHKMSSETSIASPGSTRNSYSSSISSAFHDKLSLAESPKQRHEQPLDRLVVGIDFGTTYSGVASAFSANADDIDIIKAWPGGNGITSDKVPSEFAYLISDVNSKGAVKDDSNGTSHAQMKWGFQFKADEPRLRCFKLFLDRNQKIPHFVSPLETAAQLRKCERTVMDAVSDYLTKIYEHTLQTLIRRYGSSFMNTTKLDFVLTVPAVWSDAAKNATLQAAEKAGMGDKHQLRLISEPEAAAIYTLKSMQLGNLSVGNNYIVCDAGGGTVDLIAYRVVSTKPLRVEECAVGTGSLCGAAFLNYRFEDHVKERLGEEQFQNMREKKPKTWTMGLKYFEEFVKRNFDPEEHTEINVPFPGLPDDEEIGLDSGFLMLSAEQVQQIFEPVVAEIISLVRGQITTVRSQEGSHVDGIILVGGFGQSNYLYTRLKGHFNPLPPPPYTETPTHSLDNGSTRNIEILQPAHAWTAVVRGAVMHGLECLTPNQTFISKRRTRYHYGTSYATIYDESRHALADRYWSPLWERWMVSDRMQWHIAKDIPISSDTPISFHYTRNFRPGQSLIVEDDLLACEADETPDHYDKQIVRHACTLTTDLNAVPKSLFTRLTTTKGVEFENLDFELQMKIKSADLIFELRVDGIKYGEVKAEFH